MDPKQQVRNCFRIIYLGLEERLLASGQVSLIPTDRLELSEASSSSSDEFENIL